MNELHSTIGVTLALLLILAILVLGVLAWRRQRRDKGAPDKSDSRLVWRPGDGGQP